MPNKILGEIFLQSFDTRQAFSPETELSKLLLTEINKFMWIGSGEKPGFVISCLGETNNSFCHAPIEALSNMLFLNNKEFDPVGLSPSAA
jgi:hypothetical protein